LPVVQGGQGQVVDGPVRHDDQPAAICQSPGQRRQDRPVQPLHMDPLLDLQGGQSVWR